MKYVTLSSKMAADKGIFGLKYASKEKMYVMQNAFMIPKSSPLQARKKECNVIVNKRRNSLGGLPH